MSDYQDKYVETDFRQWYTYSQSAQSSRMSNHLKSVIKNKQSQHEFTFESERTDGEELFYISESYNPTLLRLNKPALDEFLSLIEANYADEEIVEEKKPQEPAKQKSKPIEKEVNTPQTKEANKTGFLLDLLSKISSVNRTKHSLYYSLLAFTILQIVIIPGNIGYQGIGGLGRFFFFTIVGLAAFLNIWSYSKLYCNIQTYNAIFKLTAQYCSLFFLLVFMEVAVIDMFGGNFTIWFSLLLVIFGQVVAIILSLFITMVIYFIKGGKLLNIQK